MKKYLMTMALSVGLMMGLLSPAHAQPEVLGYKAWKTQRVDEAKLSLERVQLEASPVRGLPSEKPIVGKQHSQGPLPLARVKKGGKGETRLQQAQMNLEIATELTINDYFVLYLGQLNNDSAILEAAKKMSPEEVAELMVAYKRQLEGGRSAIGLLPPLMRDSTRIPIEKQPTVGL